MTDKTRMTALNTSVGADDGRSLTKCTGDSITDETAEIKDFEELQRKMRRWPSQGVISRIKRSFWSVMKPAWSGNLNEAKRGRGSCSRIHFWKLSLLF